MTKTVKKHEFLLPFPRLFTRSEESVYDSIPFQSSESFGDETAPALASPIGWDVEAVAVMAEAACKVIPADLRAIEENTVPSWLWRHQGYGVAGGRSTRRATEGDLRDIFDRVTGSAAAKGWKLGLFTSEKHARAFTDEARYALMQRHIALAPDVVASWGLSWAYGIDEAKQHKHPPPAQTASLTNAAIDGLTGRQGKDAGSSALWKKLFAVRGKEVATVGLRLSDIAADWHPESARDAS